MIKDMGQALAMANHLRETGDLKTSEWAYQQILQQEPDQTDGLFGFGVLRHQMGNINAALELVGKAIELEPTRPEFYNSLGIFLKVAGRADEGLAYFDRALKIKPDYADALFNKGNTLREKNQSDAAIDCYQKALHIKPDFPEAYNNMGNALRHLGRLEQAVDAYRQALKIKPAFNKARSNLLFTLSNFVMRTPEAILEEHKQFDHLHNRPERACTFKFHGSLDPGKRLRIAYVSPDLRHHAVSFFLEPLLEAHDRNFVEIFCYAEVAKPDSMTERLKSLSDHWRSTVGQSDENIARTIHEDKIDILIDLAGHTGNNRLTALTYKPAPIQATYLGYFTTTGLSTMDYWITDEVTHPEQTVELAVETIARLPRCCVCYKPPVEAPDVKQRTDANNSFTFGCFNELGKISPQAIDLWSNILDALPQSRLMLKTRHLAEETAQTRIIELFTQHGIDPERLDLRPHTTTFHDHLATYNEIDIALDTVLRTGVTTTADALWMGVPVITLAGQRFIQRMSTSMLTAVNMQECIAITEDDYVAKAVSLAKDSARRKELRSSLRQKMADSPLCDARGIAIAFEHLYRGFWHQYLTTLDKP